MNSPDKETVRSWASHRLGVIALALTLFSLVTIYVCFLLSGFLDAGPYDWFTKPILACAALVLPFAMIVAIVAVVRNRRSVSGWIAVALNLGSLLMFVGLFPFSMFFHGHR
jgi:hypothetical protein